MEPGLKQRLTGAAVIVILAVIFIPMLLDTTQDENQTMGGTNIPPQPAEMPAPATEDFSSRIVPLQQSMNQAPGKEMESAEPAPVPENPPPSDNVATVKQSHEAVVANEDQGGRVGVTAWVVQLGSFSSENNAQTLNQKLRQSGFKAFVEPLKQDNGTVYRVRIGPELKRSDADSINDRLKKEMQIEGIVVHYP